jgi:hypothetical protein
MGVTKEARWSPAAQNVFEIDGFHDQKGEGIVHEAVSAFGGINPFDERVCSGRA